MPSVRLLLADDDRLVLGTLEKGLDGAGYQVAAVLGGEEALERARRERFDLALLDIRMPGISGIELARQLRIEHGLACLILSAYDDQALVEQAVAEGALGYLIKPMDTPRMIPAIQAALARARELDDLRTGKARLEATLGDHRQASTAVGILMERRGLSQQEAFEVLRARARAESRKLEAVARDLVEAAERLNSA